MEGGTCLERLNVLEDYGYDIFPINFNMTSYDSDNWDLNRIQRSIEHRMLNGPMTIALNNEIIKKAHEISPDIVWIDKGRIIFPSTIKELKKFFGAICIHYTADPAFTVHTSRHFNRAIKFYDLCITNKKYEIETYKKFGANEVLFVYQGVDDSRFKNLNSVDSPSRNGSIFIGHCENYYIETLRGVLDLDSFMQIHGSGWTRRTKNIIDFNKKIYSDGVWGEQYPITLANAKIGFGFLCKAYPDQFTTRSFEIPAAGTMLIAERTQEHMEIFEEDKEAVFFSGTKELRKKLSKYLDDDYLRCNISSAGQRRVMEEFTWKKVMLPAITYLESL